MFRFFYPLLFITLFSAAFVDTAIAQPPPQLPAIRGQAVGTCFSNYVGGSPSNGIANDFVAAIIDIHTPVPPLWTPTMYHGPANSWRSSNLGQVFGIAIDKRNNIYLTATTSYGSFPGSEPLRFGPAGSGGVYRLDGVTGTISNYLGAPGTFITTAPYTTSAATAVGTSALPNGDGVPASNTAKPGLGNICYALQHDKLYVTNFEDGTIYRINPLTGKIDAYYDPVAPANPGGTSNPAMALDNGTLGFAPAGDRIWGIAWNRLDNRIYYSVWVKDNSTGSATLKNVIRSVQLDAAGLFVPGSDRLDLVIPDPTSIFPGGSNPTLVCPPVADIAFSSTGKMLLAERSMGGPSNPSAHQARCLQYSGTYPTYVGPQQIFVGLTIGAFDGQNSAGGVDYGYGSWDPQKRENVGCDSAVWITGDVLSSVAGFGTIYGVQRSPAIGNTLSTVQSTGFFIDYNGLGSAASYDKTQIGDVEVYRVPCDSVKPPGPPPCDKLSIRTKKDNTYGDQACCFTFDVINGDATGYPFTQITATVITPGVTISNATAPAGWTTSGTGGSSTWMPSSGTIPSGTTSGFSFCLNIGLTNPPQALIFTWVGADGSLCRDTIRVDCKPPAPVPGCASLSEVKLRCRQTGAAGSIFQLGFLLHNESLFYVISQATIISVTPGTVSVSPTTFNFGGGIPTNGTSTQQSLTINGAKPGDTVCLRFELTNAAMTWCCKFDTCFIMPPCRDCCDSTRIKIDGQISHNGQGTSIIGSSITVGPKKVIHASATIISAHIKRFGTTKYCGPTTNWTPVYGDIINPPISLGGLPYDPIPQPFSTPPPPGYREASWGTVPSGVVFSGVPLTLQVNFPAPPTPIGNCYDSLRFCVRYSFTDSNCVTCDTLICYQQKRVGSIIHINPTGGVIGTKREIRDVDPIGSIVMVGKNDGTLRITLPQLNSEALPDEEVRVVGLRLEPSVGVKLVSLDGSPSRDNGVTIAAAVRQGESKTYAIVYDNYANSPSFSNTLRLWLVRNSNLKDTIEMTETVLARVPGVGGGDIVGAEVGLPRPVAVRTFMLYFANANSLKTSISRVTLRLKSSGKILAFGPPEDSAEVQLEAVIGGVVPGGSILSARASSSASAPVAPGGSVRPLYLTIAGTSGDSTTVEYISFDTNGVEVSRGEVILTDPLTSTVRDDNGDPTVTRGGGSIDLLPVAPNPGGSDRTIRFSLIRTTSVLLSVYNSDGEEVARIIDGKVMPSGDHVVVYPGGGLPNGTYFVRLQSDHETRSATMIVVK